MRFGIMVNGMSLQFWQAESIRLLLDAGHSCELIIAGDTSDKKPASLLKKIRFYPYRNLLVRIYSRLFIRPEAKKAVPLPDSLQNVPVIICAPAKKGYAQYFSKEDCALILSYQLDFILRYGFSIMKGEILQVAKYGIWSYHHDDERKYRGVPTGFWEIWYNDPVNAVILQRLTERVDGGVVLKKGYFRTISHSWKANLNHLLLSAVEWPRQVCTEIEQGNCLALKTEGEIPTSPLRRLPGNLLMTGFLLKLFFNKIKFHLSDLFIAEKWTIGIIHESVSGILEGKSQKISWLPELGKGKYLADPFGFTDGGLIEIFCESYNYKYSKGDIVHLKCNDNGEIIRLPEEALHDRVHLAYPYSFESEGVRYCIPETSGKAAVQLYRIEADGKLEFVKNLIEGINAVDPTLIRHQGRWWLFFTDSVSTNERLHIWSSESLSGEYQPHINNPVKTDIRSARPAGVPFIHNGQLIRPAQDCSVHYGSRIVFNSIRELTPVSFSEETIYSLEPQPRSRYNKGIHTICRAGNLTIIDGKRHCFIMASFINKIRIKTGKLIK